MYLFTRSAAAKPERMIDTIGYAVEIAQTVNRLTGMEVGVWQAVYGAPLTTFTWSTMAETHAVIDSAGEKLMADGGYLEAIATNSALFAAPAEDSLSEVLATANESEAVANYVNVTTAQCGPGKVADAMAWGVDMLQHAAAVTGLPSFFCRSLYGDWGTVAWVNVATAIDQVDAATAALSADPGYIERIDDAEGLFEPGSGHTYLSRRLS